MFEREAAKERRRQERNGVIMNYDSVTSVKRSNC